MEEEEKKNFLDLFQTGDLADIEVKKLVTELWPGCRSQPVLGRLRDFFFLEPAPAPENLIF